ncbi:MAG: bifunctional oligoribonuclease/PAP phosphatase NrnA [Anaeroplasmataceae bacterium]|nr:bifunctional oligoribonuclease/PAP phosphatase NrnA [Anaeroplasmataceae bacterium]MDE5867597.1 bifunctional oligoribonuclease/PAP phosphatase NrnA [Anaeroplasmataceae bacterium]
MDTIRKYIEEYDTIIIHGHIRPDGDCIGSQYGLYHLIKANYPNKNVYVTGETSEYVSFIGRPTLIDEALFKDALSICVDCAISDRLSDQRYTLAKEVIKIDHHIPVEDYGSYQYVDVTAPACAQIITELYLENKKEWVLTKEAALALYVGISTDTGRFKFDSVTSRTFLAAATLVDCGIDLGKIDNYLSVETLDTLKLKGYILSNFKITENGFAYITLNQEQVLASKVSYEDAAAQISTISTIEGCPVWALFIEYPDEIRIRLRSRGPVINMLAEEYHGGGHAKASGARLDSWDELDGFVQKADEIVKSFKGKA